MRGIGNCRLKIADRRLAPLPSQGRAGEGSPRRAWRNGSPSPHPSLGGRGVDRTVRDKRLNLALKAMVIAMIVALASTVRAAVVINEVAVTVLPRPTAFGAAESHHGYMEYRVALANRSAREKRVDLRLPAAWHAGGEDNLRSVQRSVTLAPGAPAIVSLIQPAVPMDGDGLLVRVGNASQRVPLSLVDHIPSYTHSGMQPAIMLSQLADNALRSALQSRMGSGGSGTPGFFQSEIPIEQWSGNWLGYSRYDGIVISAGEIQDASIEVVEALGRYVAAGGTMIVTGEWRPPTDWRPHGSTQPGYSVYHCGFGAVMVSTAASAPPHHQSAMVDLINAAAAPWRSNYSVEEANRHFPVVDDLQVPVKGLLVLMIGFAVLIGPVNLWVLAKYKKRMWLLWTVPTFSLLTCLAVWVYATAAEGWSGHERVKTVTILDQRNLTATTIGWAAFYAPITPGGGLTYAMSTELTPQIGRFSGRFRFGYGGDSGRPRTVDLDNGQHLATGWIVARVPAHFQVRKTADTVRQRLNFRGSAAAGFEVVNGLGVDVQQLTFADAAGNLYAAGPIPAGQTAKLNARPGQAKAGHDAWRWIYENDWVGAGGTITRLTVSPETYVRPGTYLAVLDGEPFLESGLGKTGDRRVESVVLGYAEPNAAIEEAGQ